MNNTANPLEEDSLFLEQYNVSVSAEHRNPSNHSEDIMHLIFGGL